MCLILKKMLFKYKLYILINAKMFFLNLKLSLINLKLTLINLKLSLINLKLTLINLNFVKSCRCRRSKGRRCIPDVVI